MTNISLIFVIKETRPVFLYSSTNSIFVVTRPSWAGRLKSISFFKVRGKFKGKFEGKFDVELRG